MSAQKSSAAPSAEFLTVDDCAAVLAVSRRVVKNAIARRELKAVYLSGRTVRVHRAEWAAYLARIQAG